MKQIPLTQGKYAIVDDTDYEFLMQFKWCASKNKHTFYARTMGSRPYRKQIYMHRLILNSPNGFESDHINNNGLDNRRQNLRICNQSQNRANSKRHIQKTSTFKGVSRVGNKWRATIAQNYKQIHLGYFQTEIEAAQAYDKKAKELFGEFANLNFKERIGGL